MAHSNQIRKLVFQSYDNNIQVNTIVKLFNVSRATVFSWLADRKVGKGEYIPFSRKGMYYKANIEKLKEFFLAHPDAYDKEAVEVVGVTATQILYLRKQLNITVKKNRQLTKKQIKN
jgi:transposase